MLQKKLLQFFQTKDYKIHNILEGINFILHLSYLSDVLGAMNHCNYYFQGSGSKSKVDDFAIKLTGEGKVRFASHMRLFDPRDAAFQLFVRNTEDLFCFAIALTPLISSSRVVEDLFFCSLTHWWPLFDCSTFPQVALSMKILSTLRLPSSKSSIHNNDSHIVRFV